MRVLSLFDGMACWYEALQRAWIPIDVYYASEIDKYAIQIAKKNHPDIIEIWDVTQIKGEDYDIDLLIWWSPCQWFSMAGKMLNFEDPRSKLFFEYIRILKETKPKYFLLENVKMKKEFRDAINSYLRWIEPTLIDSALVSAQHRERYYRVWVLQDDWTYAKVDIPQPEDKGILLKDVIIQWGVDEKYHLTDRQIKVIQRNFGAKSAIRNQLVKWELETQLNIHKDEKSNCVVSSYSDKLNMVAIAYAPWSREFETQGWKEDKSPTICARDYKDPKIVSTWVSIRKLTPEECERLQTLPDKYTEGVSNTQRYKALWNWRTVDVIAHILSFIK